MELNRPWYCGHCNEKFDHIPRGFDRKSNKPLCLNCWHVHVSKIIKSYNEQQYLRMLTRIIDRLRRDPEMVFMAATIAGTTYSAYHLDKSRRRIEEKLKSGSNRTLAIRFITEFSLRLISG